MTEPSLPSPGPLEAFCRRVIESGDLASKLATPPPDDPGAAGAPATGWARPLPQRPERDPGLQMRSGGAALPRPDSLRSAEARATCLSRFAHHELQAVEYFAWALLRWPEAPAGLRRGWVAALQDEQRHCQLYLDRLEALGGRFDTGDHSDYFWRQADAITQAEDDLCAFLAAIGLTLEQANLDFTLTYRDAFASVGDTESAAICQRVHDDEIVHVALALRWLERLTTGRVPARSDDPGLDAYLAHVPFPMGPARAKGRQFAPSPRQRAGLSETFIEHVREARTGDRDLPAASLLANLGAEESIRAERPPALPPPARTAAALWRLCFPRHAEWVGEGSDRSAPAGTAWPRSLGSAPSRAAFEFLDTPDVLHAWLNTARARNIAESLGLRLAGPAPSTTLRHHDKAFAVEASDTLGATPAVLRNLIEVIDPSELADPEALFDRLDARLRSWPRWTRGRFTLKPRLGSSGRGRVAGRDSVDRPRVRSSLARLAERGGAIFEPWLDRCADFSVSLYIAPPEAPGPGVTLLGSLECWNSASGVYRGHFGEIDARGRVFSGDRQDETLRADAAAVAARARDGGFYGPCGVDGFRFGPPPPSVGEEAQSEAVLNEGTGLRSVVEFNARPTMGLVAIGLARRALPRVRKRLAIEPGMRCGFALTQRAADDREWRARAYSHLGADTVILDLSPVSRAGDPQASLIFNPDPDSLRAARSRVFDC